MADVKPEPKPAMKWNAGDHNIQLAPDILRSFIEVRGMNLTGRGGLLLRRGGVIGHRNLGRLEA